MHSREGVGTKNAETSGLKVPRKDLFAKLFHEQEPDIDFSTRTQDALQRQFNAYQADNPAIRMRSLECRGRMCRTELGFSDRKTLDATQKDLIRKKVIGQLSGCSLHSIGAEGLIQTL